MVLDKRSFRILLVFSFIIIADLFLCLFMPVQNVVNTRLEIAQLEYLPYTEYKTNRTDLKFVKLLIDNGETFCLFTKYDLNTIDANSYFQMATGTNGIVIMKIGDDGTLKHFLEYTKNDNTLLDAKYDSLNEKWYFLLSYGRRKADANETDYKILCLKNNSEFIWQYLLENSTNRPEIISINDDCEIKIRCRSDSFSQEDNIISLTNGNKTDAEKTIIDNRINPVNDGNSVIYLSYALKQNGEIIKTDNNNVLWKIRPVPLFGFEGYTANNQYIFVNTSFLRNSSVGVDVYDINNGYLITKFPKPLFEDAGVTWLDVGFADDDLFYLPFNFRADEDSHDGIFLYKGNQFSKAFLVYPKNPGSFEMYVFDNGLPIFVSQDYNIGRFTESIYISSIDFVKEKN